MSAVQSRAKRRAVARPRPSTRSGSASQSSDGRGDRCAAVDVENAQLPLQIAPSCNRTETRAHEGRRGASEDMPPGRDL